MKAVLPDGVTLEGSIPELREFFNGNGHKTKEPTDLDTSDQPPVQRRIEPTARGYSKWTPEMVDTVMELKEEGHQHKLIAKKMGISRSSVSYAVQKAKGQRGRHFQPNFLKG